MAKKKITVEQDDEQFKEQIYISFKKEKSIGSRILENAEKNFRAPGNEILWLLKQLELEGHPYFKK